jgi:hypothetical protein
MQDAEIYLRKAHSDWWIAAGVLSDQSLRARPVNHI